MGRIEGRDYYFWDTSAIAKRYAREPGTDAVDEILDDVQTASYIASLTMVEIHTTLGRKLRNGEITQQEYDDALDEFAEDLRNRAFNSVRVSSRDVVEAIEMAKRYPIGGLDAVILAIGVNMWRGREDEVLFVVCDTQMRRAVNAEGFSVYDPAQGLIYDVTGEWREVRPA